MALTVVDMKSIDSLAKKAHEYKEKGLSEKEIGDELHLSPDGISPPYVQNHPAHHSSRQAHMSVSNATDGTTSSSR